MWCKLNDMAGIINITNGYLIVNLTEHKSWSLMLWSLLLEWWIDFPTIPVDRTSHYLSDLALKFWVLLDLLRKLWTKEVSVKWSAYEILSVTASFLSTSLFKLMYQQSVWPGYESLPTIMVFRKIQMGHCTWHVTIHNKYLKLTECNILRYLNDK